MASAHDWLTGTQSLASQASLLCLQAAALEGLLAVALLLGRHFGHPMHRRGTGLGLALGMTGCVLAWFMAIDPHEPPLPDLTLDVVYLSGLLGGWSGGLIGLTWTAWGHWYFGEPWTWTSLMLDGVIPMLAGIGLRRWRFAADWPSLSVVIILQVWGMRVVTAMAGMAARLALATPPLEGTAHWIELSLTLVGVSLPLLALALLLVRSDAQIDEQQRREYRSARTDSLTGMPNRKALSERIRRHWSERATHPACLAVVELSNPQAFLARYGLDQGEHLWRHWLQAKEREWRSDVLDMLRQYNPSFFQYGDFALAIFLDGANLETLAASRTLESLLSLATHDLHRCWPNFDPTVRCAVVDMSRDQHVGDHPIPYRNITLALSSISVGVAYFNETLREDTELDRYIEDQFGRWSDPRLVPIWLQPKVRLTDRCVTGAEALLRLQDAHLQSVPAMRVVTLLRRLGRLAELEWYTIAAVVHLLQSFDGTLPVLTLAVNVSGESLRQAGFADAVRALLDAAAVSPQRLQLEIVEWTEVTELATVQHNLERLALHGISVAIDDFGTGYSNLLLLMRLPFHELKIDQSLVGSLLSGKSRTMVQLIIEMAHQNGANVVAEGVETPAIEAHVRALGADLGQGNLYARALPVDGFVAYLALGLGPCAPGSAP